MGRFLNSKTVHRLLTQALLDVPLFGTHWRWNATIALAVRRYQSSKKLPPQLQRSAAEDLVAFIFPDQLACLENLQGEREIPDHPLIGQTLRDCLTQVTDSAGLEHLLQGIKTGAVRVIALDLAAPSPLAEERRTLAVTTRGLAGYEQAADLTRPDPAAVVRRSGGRLGRTLPTRDELHDALLLVGFLTWDELGSSVEHYPRLAVEGRAVRLRTPGGADSPLRHRAAVGAGGPTSP